MEQRIYGSKRYETTGKMSSSTRVCIVSVIRAPKLVVFILHLSSACEKQENGKCLVNCDVSNVSIFSIAICCPREEAPSPPSAGGPHPPPPAAHPAARMLATLSMPHHIARVVPDPVALAPQTPPGVLHLLSASFCNVEPPTPTYTLTIARPASQAWGDASLMRSR